MTADKTFRMGELFCGCGGLAYGATTARIEDLEYRIIHQWANDYDQDACKTYRDNIAQATPQSVICQDVKDLNLADLKEIDALSFGFPCNDFSIVGEQRGINGKYGHLYQYGIAALKQHKPKWFLAENVGGLKSANSGNALKTILSDMNDAGYRTYPHLYKFENYGVPQTRHRIIIVGIRDNLPHEFRPPNSAGWHDFDNTCKTALECPPILSSYPNNEPTRQSDIVTERLMHIKPGQNAFTAALPPHLMLNVSKAKLSHIYKRLQPNKPAYTLTASGGGGTHVYHYSEPRALTNRERARLQTFPDHYVFSGKKESVRRQIGMAVPCNGARIIFEAIMRTFAGINYDSTDCNITQDNKGGENVR